jgi:hypothetical protein
VIPIVELYAVQVAHAVGFGAALLALIRQRFGVVGEARASVWRRMQQHSAGVNRRAPESSMVCSCSSLVC